MEIIDKIKILAESAKYDVSCSSSGSKRPNQRGGLGLADSAGICHSWSDDGRCVSLLKILFSNVCVYDCKYCINRKSNDLPRATFKVDELVNMVINFYKRNYIEGLFLSSGVINSADYTMKLMLEVVRKLRNEENFNGYIHLKAIPGAGKDIIDEAGFYADRMSVNIELPSEKSLKLLAPDKNKQSIMGVMSDISGSIIENRIKRKESNKYKDYYVAAGQSTQLIVGADKQTDYQIVKLSSALYKKMNLKRVYYSAYVPINNVSNLPAINSDPPLLREHRLYQADWLLRFYDFKFDEIIDERNPFLDIDVDPKAAWALRNYDIFPVEINKCSYQMLLRIPGVGIKSANRIWQARKCSSLTFEGLKKMGIVLKRAKYFITCSGRFCGDVNLSLDVIKKSLVLPSRASLNYQQLSLFGDTR